MSPSIGFALLNVNKPAGRTSRDVVNHVQRVMRPAKVGHAGTLDPLATGVLVLCLGRATRLVEIIQQTIKCYRAEFLLGQESDTEDISGVVTHLPNASRPSLSEVQAIIPEFLGDTLQTPPAYSAVKVGGKRSYDLARAGSAVELQPRAIHVRTMEVEDYQFPRLGLRIECGSGTYVRSLGRDLARRLGSGAVMSKLERISVGPFRLAESIPFDELDAETISARLISPSIGAQHLPRIDLNTADVGYVLNGRLLSPRPTTHNEAQDRLATPTIETADYAAGIARASGELIAILQLDPLGWKPWRVFKE